jgi:hypothetical protein
MMKLNFKYNLSLFLALLIVLLISLTQTSNAVDVTRDEECSTTATKITNTYTTGACETQPTSQKIKFYNAYFCKSIPSAPTTAATTGYTAAGCVNVFNNDAGSEVSVQKGIGTPIAGNINFPANGNYSYVAIELSPTVKYTANIAFNTSTYCSSGTITGDTCSNNYCWTNGSTFYQWDQGATRAGGTGSVDIQHGATCGTSAGSATEIAITLNSIDLGTFLNNATFSGTGGSTNVYLLSSSNLLIGTGSKNVSNDVAKILAIMPATLKVTDESNDIKVNYNNTQGLKVWLDQHDNANVLKSYTNVAFGIAYFDFTVTIE